MVRVKICGFTRAEDALAAVAAGADALGFVLWSGSKRAATADQARAIIATLPPYVQTVGVFVNEAPRRIEEIRRAVGLGCVQLSGDENPEDYSDLTAPVVKAFRAAPDPVILSRWGWCAGFLADGDAGAGIYGGGGVGASDVTIARLADTGRLILAGGLKPETVAERTRAVRPYAVDVASGVESAPGIKDLARMTAFIQAAKSA